MRRTRPAGVITVVASTVRLTGGRLVAVAEPVRRGGGHAAVVTPR